MRGGLTDERADPTSGAAPQGAGILRQISSSATLFLWTTGVKCKVEHTTTPPAAFQAVRNAVEGHRADNAMGALVNVLAAVILPANSPHWRTQWRMQLTLSSRPLMARGGG